MQMEAFQKFHNPIDLKDSCTFPHLPPEEMDNSNSHSSIPMVDLNVPDHAPYHKMEEDNCGDDGGDDDPDQELDLVLSRDDMYPELL